MSRPFYLALIIIGSAIYAPVSIYVFDNSLFTIFERTYFMVAGAAIVLFIPRHQ